MTVPGPFGRFTARGGDEVEARITEMMTRVRSALDRALAPREYRAVLLIGGYGRGEGGVDVRDGAEQPNNNLDLLVVTRRGIEPTAVERRADRALAPLARAWGIGIDLSAVSERTLARSPCLVIWYDMRFGHKPLLGDAAFVRRLDRFRAERIEPWDVRNLLVNRGSLLVINQVLLARGDLDGVQRRAAIRHGIKAVIGYGDALLFFLGDYHWSYAEKQRRMKRRRDVPEELRALYDEAMERRFSPRYADLVGRDLGAWNDRLLSALEPVHLDCERRRLSSPDLGWDRYADAAFRRQLVEGLPRPRTAARKLLGVTRSLRNGRPPLACPAALGYRTARPSEQLPVVFPAVAYGVGAPDLMSLARRVLGESSSDRADLRRAYLRSWGVHGDTNFESAVRELGIDLGEAA